MNMGFLDDALNKAKDAVSGHEDQVSDALDKASDIADEKTGGKFGDQIDAGVDQAKGALGIDE
jgi:hypothetical protein